MKRSDSFMAGVVMVASLLTSSCLGAQRANEVPLPANTGVQPAECQVKSITKLGTGIRADWSADDRQIFFDSLVNGTFELFRMNADGSNRQCLSCSDAVPKELRGKHKGAVSVNPDGKYIVFFAENEYGGHHFWNSAGFGINNDFWATDVDGSRFWRLTRIPKDSGIQYPKFSFDGKKFLWSQRDEAGNPLRKGREYGFWTMKMADFAVTPEGPRFANIADIVPAGRGYYEPHGFAPDGRKIIFTAMLNPEKSQYYGEIYTFDLVNRRLVNLAKADMLHFEQAVYSPSGKKISLMIGPFIGLRRFVYKTDLYLMDADGTNRARLTYFNEPGHPEYTGADTLMNKHSWSMDGTRLVGSYYVHKKDEYTMFILTFQGPCGKV